MLAAGLRAAVWRGRDAVNPDAPELMCRNIGPVRDAQRVHADAEKVVCGELGADGACPFRDSCAYQRQKATVAAADVVIAANVGLFQKLPAAVLNDQTGLVIVDESWWQGGLEHGREIDLSRFASSLFGAPVLSQGRWQKANDPETSALHTWSKQLEAAVERLPAGQLVSRTDLLQAGLTADDCHQAGKLEWQRKRSNVLRLGMAPEAWREAVQLAAVNVELPRRAALWKAAEALLRGEEEQTGRLELSTATDGSHAILLLHSRREVQEGIASRPMLLMDATMPLEIVRHFLPRVRLLGEMRAKAPHMRVIQVPGGWGKTSLIAGKQATREERCRQDGVLEELADFVRLHGGHQAAVITYQALEDRFADLPGIRTGHFNAVAGSNEFQDVEHLFVVGRPLANPSDQLAMARALTGRPIAPELPHQVLRGVLMAGWHRRRHERARL